MKYKGVGAGYPSQCWHCNSMLYIIILMWSYLITPSCWGPDMYLVTMMNVYRGQNVQLHHCCILRQGASFTTYDATNHSCFYTAASIDYVMSTVNDIMSPKFLGIWPLIKLKPCKKTRKRKNSDLLWSVYKIKCQIRH